MSQGESPKSAGWRRDWRLGAAAVVVVLALVGWLFQSLNTGAFYGRLLRSDPDAALQDAQLVAFAAGRAKPLFAEHCASCHGADMKGDRAKGIPNLADKDWLYGSGRPVEIERTVLYGIRASLPRTWNLADMPAFGEKVPYRRYSVAPLRPEQIRDVVEYVLLVGGKPADQAAAARGSKIYADSGQCFDCHANDAYGDASIGAPNLRDNIWLYGDGSRESIFKSTAHGHQGVCPAWSQRLKPGEIRALAIYLADTARAAAKPAVTQAAAQPQGKPS